MHCSAFWIGGELGPLGVSCLRSFVRQGVPITLYAYDAPADLPEGVDLADAEPVVPRSQVFRHRTGSFAVFADLFRYRLLQRAPTLYVDTDIYCLRPPDDASYIFGWEDDGDRINNAVLKLPPDSPVLEDMCRLFAPRPRRPAFVRRTTFARKLLKSVVQGGPLVRHMSIGGTGPIGLTHALKARGLDRFAAPREAFYPLHWSELDKLLNPRLSVADLTTERTCFLHLWNEKLRALDWRSAPAASPLGRLLADDA
jgi:hypothetical protein